ncbi:S8 family serine peptidase [uncultured Tateyamaria sp.]|uniref:S8 family serine peptidase n=1 Tax=uncultured Tateyamaria sp. TaxID=455651 RepID=UPI0026114C5A|nr:S8 family serine peptidase [uncultured Tateyamaria sp.]
MYNWTDTQTRDDAPLLDEVTDFRLTLAQAQVSEFVDEIWWSVLIEVANVSIDEFEASVVDYGSDLLIPAAYDAADRSREMARQPITIYARKRLIDTLNHADNPHHVVSLHLGAQTSDAYLDFDATSPELTPVTVADDAVVMAVVDDGIAIAHDLLRKGRVATRVAHASILEARPVLGGHSSVGRGLDSAAIDAALDAATFNDLLDEDLFYRSVGIVDWAATAVSTVAARTSHGTHVSGLAAGYPMEAACDNRPVICVALPNPAVEDTTGLDSLPILYLAFHILAKQAQRFCRADGSLVPVVFNFSFGNSGGPHDGTGLFATLFEHYFGDNRQWPGPDQKAWLTLPAGNINLGRLHGVAEDAGPTHFDLSVLPNDQTPTVVQIWMPTGTADSAPGLAQIAVTTPGGQSAVIPTVPGQVASLVNEAGAEIARLACQAGGGVIHRDLVTVSINPTAHLDTPGPNAPHGMWAIDVTRDDGPSEAAIHLWVRRDETLPGTRSGGRQAWFSNPDYVRFDRFGVPLATDPTGTDCPVRRHTTLSGFAGGEAPIVVAAYTERDAQVSLYSGSGPLARRDVPPVPTRDGPDLAAKGDDSYALRGVISAGSRSGSWVRLSGTSVAAPRVARAASDGICDAAGGGRDWSAHAAAQSPFPLADTTTPERAGVGGIDIPIPGFGRPPSS